VIEQLLPTFVECAEGFGEPRDLTLYPEEEAVVADAVGKRRREFGSARYCARDALRRLGLAPAPILRGERGAPQWPTGIVGSITHCDGYRAAAVACAADVLGLGIDAEPDAALPDGVLAHVSTPEERAMLRNLFAIAPGVSWDRLLFSTKEAVYKAWFPLTRRWIGFEDANIVIDAGNRTFDARILVPHASPFARFDGHWLADSGLVITATFVPARAAARKDCELNRPLE
jgi:4'-phosphopantetheinyl transferase EntD